MPSSAFEEMDDAVRHVDEPAHGVEVGGAGGGEGEQAGVLDEEQVVLPQPHLEPLRRQGARGQPADEGVLVLRLPDRVVPQSQ